MRHEQNIALIEKFPVDDLRSRLFIKQITLPGLSRELEETRAIKEGLHPELHRYSISLLEEMIEEMEVGVKLGKEKLKI